MYFRKQDKAFQKILINCKHHNNLLELFCYCACDNTTILITFIIFSLFSAHDNWHRVLNPIKSTHPLITTPLHH